ncbi:MAG: DUF4058 family protein [Planctomycetes bacterium]|nr:DUF4058 family protein [Planctomycetota bacterium]
MGSPFPGMDPYLEGSEWPDFHSTFIHSWREAIAQELPDEYIARIDERVYLVETDPEVRKLIKPDISISSAEGAGNGPQRSSGLATLAPVTLPVEIIDGVTELYIEIVARPELSLVAVLELLSPANKENPGRTEYESKRNGIFRQDVHLVELDLLCGGRRMASPRLMPNADYYYLVARGDQRPNCQVYSWNLADALPSVPVPLRSPHADVIVDLAAVFATAFERGRFGRRLRYDRPCPAPLNDNQRALAARFVSRINA